MKKLMNKVAAWICTWFSATRVPTSFNHNGKLAQHDPGEHHILAPRVVNNGLKLFANTRINFMAYVS